MRREDRDGILAYGSYGRPLLVFPAERGNRYEWEERRDDRRRRRLIEEGRVKVYCVDAWDAATWSDDSTAARGAGPAARRLRALDAPATSSRGSTHDCGGPIGIGVTGVSMGAYHAANLALRRADLFPLAVCLSGIYDVDPRRLGRARRRRRTSTTRWTTSSTCTATTSTGCARRCTWCSSSAAARGRTRPARSSRRDRFAALLAEKGIPHELDVWGHDSPHDWPAWHRQIAHHLPRLV